MGTQERINTWTLIPAIVGTSAALLTLGATVRLWFRNSIGRRRDRYRRLARLGTGAQLSFFESVLGEPPAISRTITKSDYLEYVTSEDPEYRPDAGDAQWRAVSMDFVESVFIDHDYYVQTITDSDQTVVAFSVTTRSRRFRPVYEVHPRPGWFDRRRYRKRSGEAWAPLVHVQLGKTRFTDLDDPDPDRFAGPHFRISVGAHNYDYSEFAYFGNPGSYQSFVWTASDVTGAGRFGDGVAVQGEINGLEWPDPDTDDGPEPDWAQMPAAQRFRRETTITTYTVVHQSLWLERNYPLGRFGPHVNDVRTLP